MNDPAYVTRAAWLLRAALVTVLRALVGPPKQAWTWGRVGLMGHTEVLGQFTDPHAPTFHVRELRPDGTWAEHVYTRAALFGVDKLDEAGVRRLVVVNAAPEEWRGSPCREPAPSALVPLMCSRCAKPMADHGAESEEEHEIPFEARADRSAS